jgi:hypothetical protein
MLKQHEAGRKQTARKRITHFYYTVEPLYSSISVYIIHNLFLANLTSLVRPSLKNIAAMVMVMTNSFAMNVNDASNIADAIISEEQQLKRQAELDAAQALLGVIECSPTTSTINLTTTATAMEEEEEDSWACATSSVQSQKVSNALDMLATNAAVLLECEEEEECGRRAITAGGRIRSISNPEGMEKWDSLRRAALTSARHFIQPTIMEEEDNCETVNPDTCISTLSIEQVKSLSETDVQELLVKARAKLLDDGVIASDRSGLKHTNSSSTTGTTTTSGLVLPHALDKYREVTITESNAFSPHLVHSLIKPISFVSFLQSSVFYYSFSSRCTTRMVE